MLFKEKLNDTDKKTSNYYINQVKNKKIYPENIQKDLFLMWKTHKDYTSRNKLIESNIRMALNRALYFFKKTNTFPLSELIGVANEGLMKALKTYDLSKNTKFSAHAYSWIDASLQYYIKEYSQEVHKPHNKINQEIKDNKEKEIEFKDDSFNTIYDPIKNYRIELDYEDVNFEQKQNESDIKSEMIKEVDKLGNIDKYIIINYFRLHDVLDLPNLPKIPSKEFMRQKRKKILKQLQEELITKVS